MAIPAGFIQDLLSRVDVVDVVGRHVQLKKAGANYQGLCPFHGEKTPSFTVSPTKQFFHCFGCGKNGNAIGFLMEHAGMGFVDAVTELAQQVGMQVPQDDTSPEERARAAERRERQLSLTQVLDKASAAYRGQLRSSPRAIDYLKGRGLTGEIAQRFGLGYAPSGWHFLSRVFARYDDPQLAETGLVIEREGADSGGTTGPEMGSTEQGPGTTSHDNAQRRYDRFRDRIMFPIRNVKGETIGFGGRVMGDGTPKYLNSPETPVFSKGRELYGLYEARADIHEAGFVLVTEGYMDVVALAQLGLPNAVATLGTACTPEHVHKLFRHTQSVVFSFDGDAAGRRAARKALDVALVHAGDTRSIKFLFLPEEHDPDSYIRAHGRDAFARCVSDALPLSRFLIESARDGCDLGSAEGRARLAAQARPLWSELPDGALKRQLLAELAGLVQLDPAELQELWQLAGERRAAPSGASPRPAWRSDNDRQVPAAARPTRLRRSAPPTRADHIARVLLTHSGAWGELSSDEHNHLCHLVEPHGALFAWIDAQWQEHGGQAWAALREALAGQACESLALSIMERLDPGLSIEQASNDLGELRGAVTKMMIEHIKQEQQAILANSPTPEGLQRWRELQAQWDRLAGRHAA